MPRRNIISKGAISSEIGHLDIKYESYILTYKIPHLE